MKTIKYKNKYLSCVSKQFYKFAVVLVVISMFASVLNINQTFAYFSDEATSTGNTFTAGTLDIDLDSEEAVDLGLMYPGDINNSVSVDISNTGTLDSQYLFKTIPTGSDNSACDYITMTATNGTYTKIGLIKDFTSDTTPTIDATTTPTIDATWNFDLKVNDDAPPSVWGKKCSFNWEYTAWQIDLPDSSLGFTSVKEKAGEINIGKAVVMNEILPNPEGDDNQHGLQGEWVELYNNSNNEIDLNEWYIKDVGNHTITISSDNTWNSRTKIGKKGSGLEWVVVFMNGEILNNTGDTVSFYSPTNNLVDQYTFGNNVTDTDSDSHNTPTGNNQNSAGNETAGNEGKSYARLPADGTGAWVDPIPTPGMPNELGDVIVIVQEETIISEEVVVPEELIEPEELLPSASLPADDEISGEAKPEEISPATEPEEVITEESEVVDAPIGEVLPPVLDSLEAPIVQTVEEPIITPPEVVVETEPTLVEETTIVVEQAQEETPVVEAPAVEPAPSE